MVNWVFTKSIKLQLIVLLFSLTAISVAAISFLGVMSVLGTGSKTEKITSDAMIQRVEQFMVQTASATADKNSLLFERILQKSNMLTASVTQALDNPERYTGSGWRYDTHVTRRADGRYENALTEPGSVYIPAKVNITPQIKREFEVSAYFDELFLTTIKNEPNAVAAYFMGTQGETKYYPNIGLGSIVSPDYTPVGDVFYTPATPENNPEKVMKWSAVYDDPAGNGLMISAANPVYTKQTGFTGMVGIDVALKDIAKNIESYTPIESSYAMLIDKEGRAIALPAQAYQDMLGRMPNQGEFGIHLDEVAGDMGQVLAKMRAGEAGFVPVVSRSAANLYVAYVPIRGTTFSLAIVARQSELLKVVNDLRAEVRHSTNEMVYERVLPFGLLLLLGVWAYGFVYIGRFMQPLKRLTSKTAQLAVGDFNVEPEIVRSENEIGQLTSSFNSMVADLRDSHNKIEQQNKALLHEEARLKASIRSLPFGFAIVNTKGEIVFSNSVLATLLDRPVPSDRAASREMLEQVSSEFHDVIDLLDYIRATQTSRQPMEKHVEIGPRFFRFFFTPIIDNSKASEEIIGTVMTMEDTTEVRAAERSRDEFFSIASHELRTPLTAIRGNASMLQMYCTDALKDPQVAAMVDDIRESSVRLITIVNDFLDTSRLEQGKIEFKKTEFDIGVLAGQVLKELNAPELRNKVKLRLNVAAGAPLQVTADADRVRQILINLVGNALKFTESGTVTIDVSASTWSVRVAVIDTGRGIPIESQHLLFHKFQQATNNILTRDSSRSTGLGLYISKLMAENMDGRLFLESTAPNKGSTFVLELPAAKSSDKVARKR